MPVNGSMVGRRTVLDSRNPERQYSMRYPILLFGMSGLLFIGACASTTLLDVTIKETDLGAVYLERSTDRTILAAHPISIQPGMLAEILRGITVQEESGLLGRLVGGKSESVRVFNEDEVEYFAPLLTEGLTKAASDQRIGFRLGPRTSAATHRGTVYAYGRSLYVTLPWLSLASRHGAGGRALSKTILFSPESARRPDSYRRGADSEYMVIIDYEALAVQPRSPSPVPAAPAALSAAPVQPDQGGPATDTQLRTLQEQMQQKNAEVEGLKKELQDIRRQLLDPSIGAKRSRPKSKSTQDLR